MNIDETVSNWFVPLSAGQRTLGECYAELTAFGLKQGDVPCLIQFVENPKYDVPGIEIFHGATDLETHDYIHILLGRGLLTKDEAFVLGFTMGSTDRVSTTEESLFAFFTKHLYPKAYRFSDDDLRVFRDAVKLAFISACQSLARVNYRRYLGWPLATIRAELGIEEDLLRAYYAIERTRFPEAPECKRLLD
jgi:hypothetical protein